MPEVSDYKPGAFCWVDLATPDTAAATSFYGSLFGWQTFVVPSEQPGMEYTLFQAGGKEVSGMGKLCEEEAAKGVPPHWMIYVAATDAGEKLEKAKTLGATAIMEPMDITDAGRMAIFRDPQGAVISIWQARSHKGFGTMGDANTPCWFELATKNGEEAVKFYGEVFGWTASGSDMGGFTYYEWKNGDSSIGGMMPMVGDEWQGIPPHWMVYFAVADCDATAEKVKELGGKVCVPPTDIPNVGRFSVVNDPQGAVFSVITLKA